jgi:hypothetical protein
MRTIQAGILVLAGVFVVSTAVKSQAPAAPPAATVWEYSSVSSGNRVNEQSAGQWRTISEAQICYGNTQGCRSEKVTSTNENGSDADAVLKAATSLGSQGWELTGVVGTSDANRTLYFRRARNRAQ